MQIFLLRHGQCECESNCYIGQGDYPLSEIGKQQAKSWQDFFVKRPPARVVSSDLSRALQTAQIALERVPVAIRQQPALREICLGEWEGKSQMQIKSRFPEAYEERGRNLTGFRPPGGESFTDLWNRVVPCFNALTADSDSDDSLLLVTHVGVIRVVLCLVLGMDLRRLFSFGVDYAGMVHLEWKKSRWVVRLMNGTPSLC